MLFESDRGGTWDLYRHPLDGGPAGDSDGLPVVVGPEQERFLRTSPDGAWHLYQEPGRVMRIPASGGSSQEVHVFERAADPRTSVAFGVRCTTGEPGRCVLGEVVGAELVFFALDLVDGKGEELARIPVNPSFFSQWDLSHDGRRIAVATMENRVLDLDLRTGEVAAIPVDGWTAIEFVAWAADGRSLFVNELARYVAMQERAVRRQLATLLYSSTTDRQ